MKSIWAPWRMDYILDENRHDKNEDCVFCIDEETDCDPAKLILWRSHQAFVIMNRFPYNNGHLLVAPYRHVADLCELTLG
jgi:ATP adenylyltransferase